MQKVQKIQSHFNDDSAHYHALFWYILVNFGNVSDVWYPKVPWYPKKQHVLLSQSLQSLIWKNTEFGDFEHVAIQNLKDLTRGCPGPFWA